MRVQFKKILCATDFSDFSNHTINYGVALAKEFGSRLIMANSSWILSVNKIGLSRMPKISWKPSPATSPWIGNP
jgi:hypothetical protein